MLLQDIYGTRELVLVPRKVKMLLADKCTRPLESEACAESIFLVGGFDRKNLNMVGAPGSRSMSQPSLVFLDTWR